MKTIFQALTLNPVWRYQHHVDYLRKHIEITDDEDKESFTHISSAFDKSARAVRAYQRIRLVLFVLLYLTAGTAIVQSLSPALAQALRPLQLLVAWFGVGALSVLVLVFTKLVNAALTDVEIAHTHLVALAVKHSDFVARPKVRAGLYTRYG